MKISKVFGGSPDNERGQWRPWEVEVSMLLVSEMTTGDEGLGLMPERRRGLRIRQSRPVKMYEPGIGRYFGGETSDISASGLRVEMAAGTPVRVGKTVNVYVGLGTSGESVVNRRSMRAARVVWVDRTEGRVVAGVEFLGVAAAAMDAA